MSTSKITLDLPKLGSISHKKYVCQLYRRSLRLARDWYVRRWEYRENALKIRIMFEQNKNVTSPKQVEEILKQTEYILAVYHNPVPYQYPTGLNGAKWERNIPVPKEVIDRGMAVFDNN